jgi:hypothetical protein
MQIMFSVIRDLAPAYEPLSHLLPHAAWLLVIQCGIGMVVSTLMWHWVKSSPAAWGRGCESDSGA